MTQEEMIEQLENTILLIRQNGKDWWDERDIPVLQMAIADMRKLRYLDGRPCEVCACHNENGCGVWECMFDGKEQE